MTSPGRGDRRLQIQWLLPPLPGLVRLVVNRNPALPGGATFFRPYRAYLDGTQPIPARARWLTIALVWVVVGASAWAISSTWLTVVLIAAALTGSVFILRWRRDIGD